MREYSLTLKQGTQIHASCGQCVSYCAIAIVLISGTQLRGQSYAPPPPSETSFYAAGGDTAGIAIGDLDGTSTNDIVVRRPSLWLLDNSGYLQFSGAAGVAVGDVNEDRHPYAVASMPAVNGLSVLRGARRVVVSEPHNRLIKIVSTPVFTDDPLAAHVTIIKAIHLSEVRDAVNMMRIKAGLTAVSWTDAASPGLAVKAGHVTELRNALTPALTALMRSAVYTDPSLAAGVAMKAVHIQEIRDYTKTFSLNVSRTGSGAGTVLCAVNGGANGTCAASYDFGSSVAITATASTGSAFTSWTGCDSTSTNICTVGMTADKTVTAAFTLVQPTLSITKVGTGTVQCLVGTGTPGACAASYPYNTQVAIEARPLNGSGTMFGGFGGACSGIVHDCTVTMTSPLSVTVNFIDKPYNVVFVSSQMYPSNLGGARAYDTQCNALASAAGINNSTGTAFSAWMSDFNSNAIDRLSTARGFIRVDGAYISDLRTDISGGRIMNPIDLDETGQVQAGLLVYTGTNSDTTASASHCLNWTGGTGQTFLAGITSGGPSAWTAATPQNCGSQAPIYCFEKDRSAILASVPLPAGAKRIYLLRSPAFVSGGGITSADNVCNLAGNKGPLTGTYKAFLATSSTSAAARVLFPSASYYTTDLLAPQLIGTGSQIASGVVNTGIWAGSNGSYSTQSVLAWTGSTKPGFVGTAASTCNNWSAVSGFGGIYGSTSTLIYGSTLAAFWNSSTADCGSTSLGLYCVEQ